ncbi:penicillin-binding transpeptidase domain-containing protein [Aquirufa sp. KTFRIE-69F]|uniref:Beta-lactamase n=1 Tax=Aquirufa originis TaxID=3096514 RepID=A0ABW6D9I8_9BACT
MFTQRRNLIFLFFGIVGLLFLGKLFFLQVIDDTYEKAADNNAIRKIIQIPFRGEVYDRYGKLIVYNTPVYDLYMIPRKAVVKDTNHFCRVFRVTKEYFIKTTQRARAYSRVKPSLFLKHLSKEDFASVQDAMVDFPGFFFETNAFRTYQSHSFSNALGYVAEISPNALVDQKDDYYRQGDYVGISGIESFYEETLRGQRGVKYRMVNSNGVEKGDYKNGSLNINPVSGNNLYTSIDLSIQEYADSLMQHKVGSLVAIEPSTGEILAMVSAPSYDASQLTGNNFSKYYQQLALDPMKPLLNRPPSAYYRPGSTFKLVQALVGQQLGFIGPGTVFSHAGAPVKCHGHGPVDLRGAIRVSCNPYFYHAFRKMIYDNTTGDTYERSAKGLQRWADLVANFGFGRKLGVDLGNEKKGILPNVEYYNSVYKGEKMWKFSNIYSISIGEGEIVVSPLKMANLAAIIANRGWYIPPHVVKGVGLQKSIDPFYKTPVKVGVESKYFNVVIDGMEDAVTHGTVEADGRIPDIKMVGKTGTSQNQKGKDHSIFIAFAPRDNPKIAIAVFVENAGFGGSAAAPIASLVVEKYLKRKVDRKAVETKFMNMNYLPNAYSVVRKKAAPDSKKK